MKETRYADGRYPGCGRNGVVRYLIKDNECIFSGMSGPEFMTTINAAEYVIEAIAEAEGVIPEKVTFFDLCTHHGYSHLPPGGHDFMRLDFERVDGELHVTGWTHCACPPDILREFGVLTN